MIQLAIVLFLVSALQAPAHAQEDKYMPHLEKIWELRGADASEIISYVEDSRASWKAFDPETRGKLILAACDSITSGQYSDAKKCRLYARKLAIESISNDEDIPAGAQYELIRYIQPGDPKTRYEDLSVWIAIGKRIENAFDEIQAAILINGDVFFVPISTPKRGSGFNPEIGSSSIQDPETRKRYEQEVKDSIETARIFNYRHDVKKAHQYFNKLLISRLIMCFSREPYDLKELKDLLNDSSLEDVDRQYVLDQVTEAMRAAGALPVLKN